MQTHIESAKPQRTQRPAGAADPLWNEIEAFLCRSTLVPAPHRLGPHTRLRRDLRLSPRELEDLMERYFGYFRVRRGDYDREHLARARAWPWRRARRAPEITAEMLLRAARRGCWSSSEPSCAQASSAGRAQQ